MSAAFVISASYDKQIRFWDAASCRTVRCFSFQDSQVNALLLIPDTTFLVVAGFGVLRVYDIGAANASNAGSTANAPAGCGGGGGGGSQAPPLLSSYENQSAMNMTSLGSFPLRLHRGAMPLFGSLEDSSSSFFNATVDLSTTQRLPHEAAPPAGPDELSTALYATSEDGHIRLFSAATPTTLQLICDIATRAAITCSALAPDRQTLFTGSQIGRVSVWHLPTMVEAAMEQMKLMTNAPPQAPLQELSFDMDYTAVRSIAVEPLARWAVAATNAGKLHFFWFVKRAEGNDAAGAGASDPPAADPLLYRENTSESDSDAEGGADQRTEASLTLRPDGSKSLNASNLHDSGCVQLESVYRSALVSNDRGSIGLKGNVLGSPVPSRRESYTSATNNSPEHRSAQNADSPSEQKAHMMNYISNVVSSDDSSLRERFLMKVFHSFQAHYKYILKVAISPNTDLLVTCCADYTVGRFLIPKELQMSSAVIPNSTVDDTSSGRASEHLNLSTTVPMASDGIGAGGGGGEKVEARRLAQGGAPEVALAVASLLQPIGGGEDTKKTSAEKPEGTEVKPLENTQSGKEQKNIVRAATEDMMNTQPATKGEQAANTASTEALGGSSYPFSVTPSLSMDGNNQPHSKGVVQFIAMKPLTSHSRWVWDCVFSDCGRFLFTASSDHYLRRWEGLLTDHVQSTCFIGHTKPVICCILYYEKKRSW